MIAPGDKALVIGSRGMLGQSLVAAVDRAGVSCVGYDRDEVELGRPESIAAALDRTRPTVVFNAAAFTDVAVAERPEFQQEVFTTNRDGPGHLARACASRGAGLVHVSTDYVFDGRSPRPYREEDPPNPLQVYGLSKLEGERAVREALPSAIIARTSTLYGPGRTGRPTYVDAILTQAQHSTRIEVVELPRSSPTYAPDLARALLALWWAGADGIVHVVNDGACTRLELARAIVEEAGLIDVVEVAVQPEPAGSLTRPAHAVLDTTRLESLVGWRLRPWREALREYLRR